MNYRSAEYIFRREKIRIVPYLKEYEFEWTRIPPKLPYISYPHNEGPDPWFTPTEWYRHELGLG